MSPLGSTITARALRRSSRAGPEPATWRELDRYVQRLSSLDERIVVGPWLSELGFEVLYWIPFVSWLADRHDLPGDRFTIVTRGGTAPWYGLEGAGHVDLLEVLGADEFREFTERRWKAGGGQKQMTFTDFDREAIELTGTPVRRDGRNVLHPGLMYRLFRRFFRETAPVADALEHLHFRRLAVEPYPEIEARLPAGPFYAAKFYSRPSFPETSANARVIADAIDALARRAPVVLLETGLHLDDHREMNGHRRDGAAHEVTTVLDGVPAARNLAAQAAVIRRANAFVGTYGGFSYLAPSLGVPSFALYSAPEHFMRGHLDLARRQAGLLGTAITTVDARSALSLAAAGLVPSRQEEAA